jgi:hypothetical protein
LRVIGDAIEVARSFVAVSGLSADAEGPLRDLDDYADQIRILGRLSDRPVGRSRAHALIGLCAWDLIASEPVGPRFAEASGSGRVATPLGFTYTSDALGRILAGTATSQIVLSACNETLALASQDHATADIVADLLLGFFRVHSHRIGAQAGASLLRTVVRVRAANEDPTALALARQAIAEYPLQWQTVDAVQSAVRVASAHRLFERAHQLCSYVDAALLDGIALPNGRERIVEDAEYAFWNLHQRSATLRRQLDLDPTPRMLRLALDLVSDVDRALDRVMLLNSTIALGDAVPSWAYYVDVRAAEIHLAGSEATSDADRAGHLRAAEAREARARHVANTFIADGAGRIPLTKVALRHALARSDYSRASELLWSLHGDGWPLARTVPAVRHASVDTKSSLPVPLLSTIQEIRDREMSTSSASRLVDDSNQRRLGR